MIIKYKQTTRDICSLFSHHYVYTMLLILSKSGIKFTGYYILIRAKFWHAQISVPKISIPML